MITKHEYYTNNYYSRRETSQTFNTELEAIENERFYDKISENLKKIENGTAEFRLNNLGNKEYFTGIVDSNGTKIYLNDILKLEEKPYEVWVDMRNDWWVFMTTDFFDYFFGAENGKIIGRRMERPPFRYTKDNSEKHTVVIDSGDGSCDNSGYSSQMAMSTACISCM